MNLNDVYKQNHFHFHTYTSTYTHTHIQNYLHWENICIQKLLIFLKNLELKNSLNWKNSCIEKMFNLKKTISPEKLLVLKKIA
jgi:hypothetical protein